MEPETDPLGGADLGGRALAAHLRGELEFVHMELLVGGRLRGPYPQPMRLYAPDRVTDAEAAALDRFYAPVVDIGCGSGRHLLYIQRRGTECEGVDLSPSCVRIAREAEVRSVSCIDVRQYSFRSGLGAALPLGGSLGILEVGAPVYCAPLPEYLIDGRKPGA